MIDVDVKVNLAFYAYALQEISPYVGIQLVYRKKNGRSIFILENIIQIKTQRRKSMCAAAKVVRMQSEFRLIRVANKGEWRPIKGIGEFGI